MDKHTSHLAEKFKKIRLLLLDVDGVLTKGEVIYDDDGGEIKSFNVKDGLGIRLLMHGGIKVGIITGRASKALTHRCQNLGISLLYDGVKHKTKILNDILVHLNMDANHCAFVGDDLPDLSVLKRVGLAIAVRDADETVQSSADYITQKNGGSGAVREVAELILKAQEKWDGIVSELFNE